MIIELEARAGAVVRTDEDRYVCLFIQGRPMVLPDHCKHRGGPLSLGSWDAAGNALTCPWHGMRNTCEELQARALPAVRVGTRITAVVPR